jgi:penicillin amidase
MPSIWYQIGLHCRVVSSACPFDVTGVSFAGTPGVVIGHNARIAWGVTNGTVDTQDYFVEKPNPDNPDEFEYQGKFEKAEVREEVIAIKGEAPERIMVRVTRHGPIMNGVDRALADKQPMALSWAALRPGAIFESVLAINIAQNWGEFREALKLWNAPSQNFVYADIEGNIGYQFPGEIPIRANGDGSVPVAGWTGENEWTGFIPYDQLPSRYNPPEGYIVTANNAVVDAQSPLMLMKRDWDYGYRARRIDALIRAKDKHSLADIKAMSFDSHAVFADELLPVLFDAMPATASFDAKTTNAAAVLRAWDKRYASDSQGALMFETFKLKLAQAIFGDELGAMSGDVLGVGTGTWTAIRNVMNDERSRWWDNIGTADKETRQQILITALSAAADDLEKKLGANTTQWRWGALHQATFRNQTLGNSGVAPIESIFNRGPFPASGGTGLVNAVGHRPTDFSVRAVPSLRMVVDLGDLRNSALIHTTGQSGHAFHPHYDDMIAKWLSGEFNPMLWTRDDALANAEGVLTLTP